MAVRDLVIDENEAKVIRTIYRLLMEEGYGTNRVAQYLNDKGILTKKGTTLWRGTTIRAIMAERFCQPSPTDCNHPPLTCDMNPFVDDDLENLLTPPEKNPQNVCNLLTSREGD